ncbi:MAG: hypothetical protein KDM63_09260, partial [Verrucomicrobiae bacterium]|nr:hypothetical protein [Verrucomicrobiae bacterium]
GAMDWLRELPQEERSALSNSLGYALIWANPEKGAAFLLEGATEEELPNRYSQVVSAWATRNPNAAGEWLNRQPQGPALDRAKSAFSSVAARRDPESAMEWAKTITEPNLRQGGMQLVYQQWVKKDAAAANASLEQSGLPPEQIESIKKAAANQPKASPTGFRVR